MMNDTKASAGSGGGRRRLAGLACVLFLAGWLAPGSGRAQILASDEVPRERTTPEKQYIDDDMARSKLRLGPVRIFPSVSIPNAGYDSNVFSTTTDPVADWTATVAAGVRLLLPMGSKLYLKADVFPHYTWYDKLKDRNRFGGIYDLSLLGFFNRMSFQVTAADRQYYVLYSSELPSYIFENLQSADGGLEVDLTKSLSIFGSGGYQKVRFTQYSGPPLQDVQVKFNNSDDAEARGGLRYTISKDWYVAALVDATWSDFQYQSELRDNRSLAYLGAVYFNRPRLFVNVRGGYREGMSNNGSFYPKYQTPVGSFFLSFFPTRWIELQGYGSRKVTASISALHPYYLNNTVGGGANIELFDHVLVRGFVQVGPHTYPEAQFEGGDLIKRVDHTKSYGGGLSVKLPARIVLTGLVSRQIYVSNVPAGTRNVTRFTAFLNFTGTYAR